MVYIYTPNKENKNICEDVCQNKTLHDISNLKSLDLDPSVRNLLSENVTQLFCGVIWSQFF